MSASENILFLKTFLDRAFSSLPCAYILEEQNKKRRIIWDERDNFMLFCAKRIFCEHQQAKSFSCKSRVNENAKRNPLKWTMIRSMNISSIGQQISFQIEARVHDRNLIFKSFHQKHVFLAFCDVRNHWFCLLFLMLTNEKMSKNVNGFEFVNKSIFDVMCGN